MKLDRSKSFGTFFDGPLSFYGQDGRLFDKVTDEEVIREPKTDPAPTPNSPPAASADAENVACKECGKEFTIPKAKGGARNLAIGRLKAHLQKEHGITLEKQP